MQKHVIIHLAKTAGFCFGVKRAIRIAHDLARSGKTVHMLGDLVHNQQVIRELEKSGIKKIRRLGHGRGKILLIRAHGAGKSLMRTARRHGYTIVDATCPMVHAIHKIVRNMAKQGCRIIVLGDKRHEEVQGIVGQTGKKTLVIDHVSRIPVNAVKKIKKAAIVVQSTQNIDVIMPMVNALQGMINEVRFFNTICKPTQMKQAEMKTMPLRHDLVIIIGSRTSANTRRLYEISRTLNARSHWIESAREIRPAWFKGVKRIGITAGASTPQSATGAVIEKIIHLQKQSGRQLRNQSLL